MPFTAAIIKRDFASVYDTALKLGGCSFLRKLSYGNGWSRIRIGALVAVTPNGTSDIADTVLMLGLCSGDCCPGSSFGTKSAYGYCFTGNPVPGSTRTLSYAANSNFPYYSTVNGVAYRRTTIAGWQVSGGSGVSYLPLAYTGIQRRRFPIYFDITRTVGGSYSSAGSSYAYSITVAATAQNDFRPDHFLDGLDQLGTPTINGLALTQSTAVNIALGDELGGLDTFELFWNSNTFPLEVYAVGAVIISPTIDITTGNVYAPVSSAGGVETYERYTAGAQVTDLTFGTGFSNNGTVYGASYGTTVVNLLGTSGGVPMDNFEQYATGSVTSGVTLNAGTGWSTYGTIY